MKYIFRFLKIQALWVLLLSIPVGLITLIYSIVYILWHFEKPDLRVVFDSYDGFTWGTFVKAKKSEFEDRVSNRRTYYKTPIHYIWGIL